jgi:hypothetical protein
MLAAIRHARVSRLAVVLTTLAGFVFALVLVASPELHERLHHDCDDEQGHHECLATVLHAGGCDVVTPPPTLAAFVSTLLEVDEPDHSIAVPSPFLTSRILEHAPPRRA